MPFVTWLASSLKRRSDPTLPLKTCTLSRSKRTSESRLIKPSLTRHQPQSQLRDAENVQHLGAALVIFLKVGSSKPLMARLISSCSS